MLSVGFGSREAARPIHTELRLIHFFNIFIYPLLSAKDGHRAGRDSAASFRLMPLVSQVKNVGTGSGNFVPIPLVPQISVQVPV